MRSSRIKDLILWKGRVKGGILIMNIWLGRRRLSYKDFIRRLAPLNHLLRIINLYKVKSSNKINISPPFLRKYQIQRFRRIRSRIFFPRKLKNHINLEVSQRPLPKLFIRKNIMSKSCFKEDRMQVNNLTKIAQNKRNSSSIY